MIHPEFPRFFNSGYVISAGSARRSTTRATRSRTPARHVDVLLRAGLRTVAPRPPRPIDFAREVKAPRNLAIHDRVYSEGGLRIVDGHMNRFLPQAGQEYVRLPDGADL